MRSQFGSFTVHASDVARTVAFYEAAGLQLVRAVELPNGVVETFLGSPHGDAQLQVLAADGPIERGNALAKIYVETDDVVALYDHLVAAGYESISPVRRPSDLPDEWRTILEAHHLVGVAFVADPDGYPVELVQHTDRW